MNIAAITGKTKLLGVIGHPVEHSLSPAMHNAAIAHLGFDFAYLPLPVKPEDLSAAIAGFAAIGLVGFSVTIPHKQAIMSLLNDVSPLAQSVGAVNTVWRNGTGWAGTNTDVEGFIAPLKAYNRDWSETVAVILGIGGASRAVVAGCAQLGIRDIRVVARNRQKLQVFQNSWANSSIPLPAIYTWDELPSLMPQASLLVNSTPVGMYPKIDEMPVTLSQMAQLKANAIVYDLIYTPSPTQFLSYAGNVGAIAIDGLEMLVQQGAAALQIWLQQPVPVDVMRSALRQRLGLPI